MYLAGISKNLNEFERLSRVSLPEEQHNKLFVALRKIEPYYEKIIWNPSKPALQKIQAKFTEGIKTFYRSAINPKEVFEVHLVPIPDKDGNSHATVVNGQVLMQVFTQFKSVDASQVGTLAHETSHFLYESQPNEFQKEHLSWFEKAKGKHPRTIK